jgi:phosphate-selective porin
MSRKSLVVFAALLLAGQILFGQGCMEASSDEGVNVVGYLQAQYEYMFQEEDDINNFTFNRVRVGVVGNIPYDISYYSMFEFSPNKGDIPYLLDGFITYSRLSPYVQISLGQFKSPFSLELNTACQGLHTINRSLAVNELVAPDRDRGLLLTGKYKNYLSYGLAITNGTGRDAIDNNENKTFAGRIVLSPISYLSIGGSYKYGTSPPAGEGVESEDELSRLAIDLEAKFHNILVQGEFISGEDRGSYTTGGGCGGESIEFHEGSIKRSGYWFQAMYMTGWNLQPVVKFESYDPDTDADNTNSANSIKNTTTFGINYFLNDWTRLQLNYLYKAEKEFEVSNDEILFQAQVKF